MEPEAPVTWLGIYLPESFTDAPQRALHFRQSWGKKIAILSFYLAWGSDHYQPDLAGINKIIKSGYLPMITWEPWRRQKDPVGKRPEEQSDFSLQSILAGNYDDYIRQWAQSLKELTHPIFFRPMHEMNGNWYPWCGKVNGNSPEKYVAAWRYLRSIFRQAKNDKLIWVWCPYVHSVPDEPENELLHYFPGINEVDWLALDGYNWGTSREWSHWQSFQDIFANAYSQLTDSFPEKPIMIAEVGCAEEGGDKSSWIAEAAGILQERFPGIKAVVWFNINKECDWRIESSENSLLSFQKNWNFTSS